MRLKCIRLAGFKSFVDPTTVNFPSNMAAVVGPNGCGKSNIIDAVPAGPLDAVHLGVTEGAPLLRQQRLARNADGIVVEYSDDRYLPGIVSFTIENTIDSRSALLRKETP